MDYRLMDYWINEFSLISGLWDRYKLLSHGPPSIESAIPNGSNKTSHQVNKTSFQTTDTSTFKTDKTTFKTTDTSTSHVNNDVSSPENVENTANNFSSTNDVHFVIAPNVAISDVSPVKNDNVLSRQQTIGKIQPYQVEEQLLSVRTFVIISGIGTYASLLGLCLFVRAMLVC
jgi:hypothetical protein